MSPFGRQRPRGTAKCLAVPSRLQHLSGMSDDQDTNPRGNGAPAPRVARQNVFLSATLERFGSSVPTKHRVRDLSSGGMRIDQVDRLTPGATVLVTVGLLEAVGATVVWVQDGWAGLRFAANVSTDEARAKSAVAPKKPGTQQRPAAEVIPTAGWIGDLSSPYRK